MAHLPNLRELRDYPVVYKLDGFWSTNKRPLIRNADERFLALTYRQISEQECDRRFRTDILVHIGYCSLHGPAGNPRRKLEAEHVIQVHQEAIPLAQAIVHECKEWIDIVYAIYVARYYPEDDGLYRVEVYRIPGGKDIMPIVRKTLAVVVAK